MNLYLQLHSSIQILFQVDFAVVCITFISVVVLVANSQSDVAQKFAILTIFRFVRIFRLIR
jgi:hypothetical protein